MIPKYVVSMTLVIYTHDLLYKLQVSLNDLDKRLPLYASLISMILLYYHR